MFLIVIQQNKIAVIWGLLRVYLRVFRRLAGIHEVVKRQCTKCSGKPEKKRYVFLFQNQFYDKIEITVNCLFI